MADAPPPSPSLTQAASSGFMWMLVRTGGTKAVNVLAQIALAYLLSEDEWGRVALAYTFAAVASVLQHQGVGQILVQRREHFDRWATPGLSLGLTMAVTAAVLLAAIAPLADRLFNEEGVAPLIWILAAGYPINAAASIPQARLQADFRFRFLSLSTVVLTLGTSILTVGFAVSDFGSMSFVLPIPIIALCRLIWYWAVARPRIRFGLEIRRWRFLFTSSLWIIGAAAIFTTTTQLDKIVLGRVYTAYEVGLYFWAANLSYQTISVFGTNLRSVLFPTLARLADDPARQTAAALRAARLTALIAVPLCLLQAAGAQPAVELIFPDKWLPAVLCLQILSVNMAIRFGEYMAQALLHAQGRWRDAFFLQLAFGPAFLIGMVFAARFGAQNAVAIAVFIVTTPYALIAHYLAVRHQGHAGWRDLAGVYGPPLLAGGLAMAPPAIAAAYLPDDLPAVNIIRLAIITLVGLGGYLLLIRVMHRAAFEEVRTFIREQVQRRLGGSAPDADDRTDADGV